MDVVAYVISSLSILWAFGGGQVDVFWGRVLIAAPICLITALLLLKQRKELSALRISSGSWMMGVGVGFVLFLAGLLLTWIMKSRAIELSDLKNYRLPGLLMWILVLSPACEIIYRKVLGPAWGIKSSAFIEALNFGVGAVNLYLFCLVFLWAYMSSKINLRFGLTASLIARSLATLLLFLSLKAIS